jgi:hypothetical protein
MMSKEECEDALSDIRYQYSKCKHCGLPMGEHDDTGFCPPGTEDGGGKR